MKTAGLTKKELRIERKKKKISAYLAIAKLNDEDRYEKLKLSENNNQSSVKNSDDAKVSLMSGDGPSRKRLKKNGSESVEVSNEEEVNESEDINQEVPYTTNSCFNYPCTEDPYYNYYNSTMEGHGYQEPFLFEVLPPTSDEHQPFNNYYQYQSYEVRRHHNSETFYYKTDEELYSAPAETFEGKIYSILSLWDESNYLKKGQNDGSKTNGKGETSAEQYEQLKKRLRERKNFLKCIPRVLLRESGDRASLQTPQSERVPLFISDVQDFLVYSQTENTFYKPRWCNLEKPNRITKSIVLIVEGLSLKEFTENQSSLINNEQFTDVEIIMPEAYEGNLIEELSMVPLCMYQQRRICEKNKEENLVVKKTNPDARYRAIRALFPIKGLEKPITGLPKGDKFPRTELLLSAWQLLEENFPIPMTGALKQKYHYYVMTKEQYAEVTPMSPMFALDCEMCRTTTGKLELTRISVVNEDLEAIYDTLVKPYNKITDYLTKYSGITPQMLYPCNVRLSDVQRKIREILPPDAILIGQSLNSDLHAMEMMHPYIIDTSVIFNITGIRSRKTKLMTLSKEFLSENIQDSADGHCSTEDSAACMKLVKLKLANSVEFGDAVLVGKETIQMHVQEVQDQNKFKNEEDATTALRNIVDERLSTNLFFQIANLNKKGVVIGTEPVVNCYTSLQGNKTTKRIRKHTQALTAETDEKVVDRACEVASQNDFVLAHIKLDEEDKEKKIIKFKNWTKKMLDITPINGMCLILLGSGARGVCLIHINKPSPVHLC